MRSQKHHPFILALMTLAFLTYADVSIGQGTATERKGVSGEVIASVNLAGLNIDRALRMRKVTIEPGGLLLIHSHADRPSVSYVLKGALIETFEDGSEPHELVTGQAYETHGTRRHALKNAGAESAVFLEVDLPK